VSENEFARSVRTLDQIGEFGLIEQVARPAAQGPAVLLGPGDDAAVVAASDGRVAASMDLLVEGRHFRRDWSSGYQIGRKAAAQNLADIAAMGARPTALLVGLSAPGDLEVSWAVDLAAGLADESALVEASVAGGDTTGGEQIVIAVTVLGDLEGRAPVTRSGARPGDLVAIAGELGWSAAGLELLSRGESWRGGVGRSESKHSQNTQADSVSVRTVLDSSPQSDSSQHGSPQSGSPQSGSPQSYSPQPGSTGLVSPLGRAKALARHRSPEPPYAAGPAAALAGATAMLDVSDGLLADLKHIAVASGVAIDLDPALFPIEPELRELAKHCGIDPEHWFLTGGEDHALAACFPADQPLPPGWQPIGRVLSGAAAVTVDGTPRPGRQGWDHFSAGG
jgi:thiamine-monophosphate kinase